jgi:RND family efflux transporter MFP subunit
MKLSLRLLAPLAGLALVAALVAQTRDAAPPPPGAGAAAPTPSRVVAEGRLAAYPGAEITVAAEVGGIVAGLPFAEKEHVGRGELLAQLRADDLLAELAAADASVAECDAELRLAETDLTRAESLYAQQVDTASRVDRARRDLDVAGARRSTAIAEVARLEAKLAKYRVTAPITGTVLRRFVDPGEAVEAGQPIATVADLGRVRIEAEVDEFDAGRMRLGAPVRVTAEGFDGARWNGVIEEIPDAVSGRVLKPQDPGKPTDTRILLVKIRLDGPTPLKLGQRVEVTIEDAPAS